MLVPARPVIIMLYRVIMITFLRGMNPYINFLRNTDVHITEVINTRDNSIKKHKSLNRIYAQCGFVANG